MIKRLKTSATALGIFLIGTFLFTVGLYDQEIIGFESRFYLFAIEMWRHGVSAFPTTFNEPYPDYPGTSTLLIYAAAKVFGHLNKFVAIFPSACAAALTLSVTYLIGAKQSQRCALSAVCFLLLTHVFILEARTISLDQYITLITTLCFYLSLKKQRLLIFPLLALGFWIRGPIGLVIPTGVVCFYYFIAKEFKNFFYIASTASFLLIVNVALLLWFAYDLNGLTFVHDLLQKQVLGRINDAKPLPFSFYFIESLGAYALSYPVALLMVWGIKKSSEKKFLLQLLAWILVIMLGLSVPTDKKVRYILPMAPALALLCGYFFAQAQQGYVYFIKQCVLGICGVLPLSCLIGLGVLYARMPQFSLSYLTLISLFVGLQVLVVLFRKKDLYVLFFASITFFCAFVFVAEQINLTLNTARGFILQSEKIRLAQHSPLVFYKEGNDGLVIKYMVNVANETTPIFLEDIEELLAFKKPALIVATAENFAAIPTDISQSLKVVLQGNIGREPFVVFTMRELI